MLKTLFNYARFRFKCHILAKPHDSFIIVGAGMLESEIASAVQNDPKLGFNFVGDFQAEELLEDKIAKICEELGVETIICGRNIALPTYLKKEAQKRKLRILNAEEFYEQLTGKFPIFESEDGWYIEGLDFKERPFYELISRLYSLVLGIVGFLITLPFYPIIIIAIRLDSNGGPFFAQERLGKNGKLFKFIKFRTMAENPDRQSQQTEWMDMALPSDERPDVTAVGKFLRKYKIDELPQFISVIKGDMNLTGPRAEPLRAFKERAKLIPSYEDRLRIKPGLTGWAQVHPFKTAADRLQMDIFNIKHRSLFLDLYIFLRTVWVTIRGDDP